MCFVCAFVYLVICCVGYCLFGDCVCFTLSFRVQVCLIGFLFVVIRCLMFWFAGLLLVTFVVICATCFDFIILSGLFAVLFAGFVVCL